MEALKLKDDLGLAEHRGAQAVRGAALGERFALHPYLLWRIAGEPVALLEPLRTRDTTEALDDVERLTQRFLHQRDSAISVLEQCLPRLYDDREARNALLALKRDVFGGRVSKPSVVDTVLSCLEGAGERAIVAAVVDGLRTRADLEASLPACFEAETRQGQDALAKMFSRQNLANGIAFTNPRLFNSLSRHYAACDDAPRNKSGRALDDSFLQYCSRACLKTSPFSSFTPVLLGRWSEDSRARADSEISLVDRPLRRRLSLSAAILLELIRGYVKSLPLELETRLRFNQTTRRHEESLHFFRQREELSVKGMTWGVELENVKLHANPTLDRLIALFERAGVGGLSRAEIEHQHGDAMSEGQREVLRQSLEKLHRIGLLQREDGLLEQEDLLRQIVPSLAASADSQQRTLADALLQIEDRLTSYSTKDAVARREGVVFIEERMDDMAKSAGVDLSDIRKGGAAVLFEDCFLDIPEFCASPAMLGPVLDDLKSLMRIAPIFDYGGPLQSWLANEFVKEFGEDGQCDDPRAFVRARMNLVDGGIVAPWNMRLIYRECDHARDLLNLRIRFMEHVVNRISSEHESPIAPDFIDELVQDIPEAISRRPVSHSFLGQFASSGDDSVFVVNQILSGNSQLMSRFLDSADRDGMAKVAAYLNETSASGTCVELASVFGFNANVHARILDKELVVAPYPPGFASTEKTSLDELVLRYDKRCHRLQLATRDGQPVDVLYLGLLSPVLMPQLHRAISGLSAQSPFFFLNSLERAMRARGKETPNGCLILPRLRLGSLILSRKAWIVPQRPETSGSKLDAFKQLQAWRKTFSLPDNAFLRFMPSEQEMGSKNEEKWRDFDRTKLKPFYVDFKSPLLANQFVRRLNSAVFANHKLLLTETLPAVNDQHVRIGGVPHVAELQLELSVKPAGGAVDA